MLLLPLAAGIPIVGAGVCVLNPSLSHRDHEQDDDSEQLLHGDSPVCRRRATIRIWDRNAALTCAGLLPLMQIAAFSPFDLS
jgi:hypothetical protein